MSIDQQQGSFWKCTQPISHWLGPYTEWSLQQLFITQQLYFSCTSVNYLSNIPMHIQCDPRNYHSPFKQLSYCYVVLAVGSFVDSILQQTLEALTLNYNHQLEQSSAGFNKQTNNSWIINICIHQMDHIFNIYPCLDQDYSLSLALSPNVSCTHSKCQTAAI